MLFTKQRAYAKKEFLQFLRDLAHRTRWTSHSFSKFVSIINYFTLLWTTTVLSDKLNISLAPSAGQAQLDVLRDEILLNCSHVIRLCFAGITTTSYCDMLESKIIRTEWRILHFNENFPLWNWLFVLWKAKIVVTAGISALISAMECRVDVSGPLKYYQLSSKILECG